VNELRLSFGLLTAVPVGRLPEVSRRSAGAAILLAPLTTLPLLVALAGGHLLVGRAGAPALAVAALVLVCEALVTRAMHLDGLADTADGLSAGYDAESSEMKSIALLWLESISGINLTLDRSTAEARKKIAKYRATEKEAAQMLADAVVAEHLSVEQIKTLLFASSRQDVITILEGIRDLVRPEVPESEDVPTLQVAEGN